MPHTVSSPPAHHPGTAAGGGKRPCWTLCGAAAELDPVLRGFDAGLGGGD
jgi:hypothetical protein